MCFVTFASFAFAKLLFLTVSMSVLLARLLLLLVLLCDSDGLMTCFSGSNNLLCIFFLVFHVISALAPHLYAWVALPLLPCPLSSSILCS